MSDRLPREQRPTLASVAAAAGVSPPTVSKVINGRTDVAADTRIRVERVLQEQDYRPPATRNGRYEARTVGLIFDDLGSPYSLELISGVTDAAAKAGVDVVVGRFADVVGSGKPYPGDGWARKLIAAGREGIIVVTSRLTEQQIGGCDRNRLPMVAIDPINLPRADVVSVGATNWAGALAATEHLIQLGHRSIGYVGGPLTAPCSQARLHGYRAALENAGVAPRQELVTHGEFRYDNGYAAGLMLLDRATPPTAVFAASDLSALGVIEAARTRGVRVPEELSVVGFDDTYLAAWSTPPMTTVRAPMQDMGRVALRTLLRLSAGESLDSHHVELATRLVVRESTASPR